VLTAVGRDDKRYKVLHGHFGYVNVVVFSTEGDVPAQKMMAGGDNDGDVYSVFWDKELITKLPDQHQPFLHGSHKEKESGKAGDLSAPDYDQ